MNAVVTRMRTSIITVIAYLDRKVVALALLQGPTYVYGTPQVCSQIFTTYQFVSLIMSWVFFSNKLRALPGQCD